MIYTSRHCHRYNKWDKEWEKRSDRDFDPPLSPTGISQAMTFRDQLHNVKRVYCSPFLRCIQTAYYATADKNTEICIEYSMMENMRTRWFKHWVEKGVLELELLPPEELIKHYPTINVNYESFLEPHAVIGEGRRDCRARVKNFMRHIIDQKEDNIYLVGHGFSVKDCNVVLGLSGKLPYMGRFDKADYYWNKERYKKIE